jgi:hypothetical protein
MELTMVETCSPEDLAEVPAEDGNNFVPGV